MVNKADGDRAKVLQSIIAITKVYCIIKVRWIGTNSVDIINLFLFDDAAVSLDSNNRIAIIPVRWTWKNTQLFSLSLTQKIWVELAAAEILSLQENIQLGSLLKKCRLLSIHSLLNCSFLQNC